MIEQVESLLVENQFGQIIDQVSEELRSNLGPQDKMATLKKNRGIASVELGKADPDYA